MQRKIVVPAMLAMAAAVAAGGWTLTLTRRAASALDQLEQTGLPHLSRAQEFEAALGAVEAREREVVASGSASGFTAVEDLLYDLGDKLLAQDDGVALYGSERAEELKRRLEAWYFLAKNTGTQMISGEDSDAIKAQAKEADGLVTSLKGEFAKETTRFRAELREGLEDTQRQQRMAIFKGLLLLVGGGLVAMALAWWLSGRTAVPLLSLNAVAQRVIEGDLTRDVPPGSADEVGMLAASFQKMQLRLRDIVGTLKGSSNELAFAAQRLSEMTRAQTALLERQASGVAETSTTTRQLEQTSSLAASRAASVLEVARKATARSAEGQSAAERSAEELQRIQASVEAITGQSTRLIIQARQVSDIVETVRDLATQSHVLSLNASIEAARAGEAGRGFAVVASEVRALAEASGQSAGRISRIVQDITAAVQSTLEMTEKGSAGMADSLDQIRASAESLRELGTIVRDTSDAALHIASAVQQQSTGIGQIAVAMRDLDRGMEDTLGRIRTLERSAQQVADTASRISGIANGFQV
ncbi:MAG: methyl-accepting chemotaxis protein [Anaeromyxobacter sp.]